MRRDDVSHSEARVRGVFAAFACGGIAGLAVACVAVSAPAADLYWAGTGTWNTTTANWGTGTDGPYNAATWSNDPADAAIFQGTAGTVTLGEPITAAGLTFSTTGYTITGNTLTLSGTPSIATGTGISATIASTLDGTSGFTKTGAGTLTLSAANSISGPATVSAGRIVLGSNTALGTTAVTLDGGSIERNAVGSVGNAIAVGGGGGTIVAAQPVVDYTNFTGQLTGSGGLALDGLVQLSGSGGTYSGTITLADSETYLRFSTATAIASTASITTINAGIIRLDGVTVEVASVTSNGLVFNVGGGTVGRLRVGAGTMSGPINDGVGQIAIEKFGSGTLTLSGNNTYTGGTTISGGTVVVGNLNAFGAEAGGDVTRVVVNSGGAVNFNGVTDATYGYTIAGSGSGSGALVNNGAELGTATAQTTNIRLSADAGIGGTGNWALLAPGFAATSLDLSGFTLTKTGGNAVRLRNSTITAGTIVINQGRLTPLAGTTGNSAVAVTLANAANTFLRVESGGTFTIGSLAGGGATGGSVELVNSSLTVGGLNTDTTFSGQILGTSGTGQLTKVGTGTLTLAGNSTYSGGTFINGGLVKAGSFRALGAENAAASTVTIASGATLDINRVTGNTGDFFYGVTIAGSGTAGQGALINTGGNGGPGNVQTPNISLSSNASIGGSGNILMINFGYGANSLSLAGNTLTKTGSNTFFLANTTVSAGTIDIQQGTLSHFQTAANASAAAITLANAAGATLDLNSLGLTVGSLAGGGATGGNVTLGSATLTLGSRNENTSFSGSISGTGAIVKTGTGTQTFAAANTYSGGTTINGGTLTAGNANAFGTSGAISVGASGTLGVGDGVTFARPFSLTAGGRVRTGNTSTVSLPSVAALAAWESQSGVGDQTLAEILNASGSTTPTALFSAWTANPDSSRYFSDILTLEGTGADNTYVLSMDYAAAFDNLNIWYRTNIGDSFTPLGTNFQGNVPWSSGFTAVGQYGVDTSAGTVWVVTDHNSQFVIVPEPGTMVLTGLGLTAIGLAATRKRRA